jgi:hypothetical protein
LTYFVQWLYRDKKVVGVSLCVFVRRFSYAWLPAMLTEMVVFSSQFFKGLAASDSL